LLIREEKIVVNGFFGEGKRGVGESGSLGVREAERAMPKAGGRI
jgi:hypothetical protein